MRGKGTRPPTPKTNGRAKVFTHFTEANQDTGF